MTSNVFTLRPSRRRAQRSGSAAVAHISPALGRVDPDGRGMWAAIAPGETKLATYPTREEAAEALLVRAIFDGMPCIQQ